MSFFSIAKTSAASIEDTHLLPNSTLVMIFGLLQGTYVSMGIISDGSYGIPEGITYSFPVTIGADRCFHIVQGLSVDEFSREKMDATANELMNEKRDALAFLQPVE